MTDTEQSVYFNKESSTNSSGRPFFWKTTIRLYKNNDVLRGAFDMVIIGSFVLILMGKYPSFFEWIKHVPYLTNSTTEGAKTQSHVQNKTQVYTPTNILTNNVTTQTPFDPVIKSNTPNPTPLPKNPIVLQPEDISTQGTIKSGTISPYGNVWIGELYLHEQRQLDEAKGETSTNTEKAISMVYNKAHAGDPNAANILATAYANDSMNRGNKIHKEPPLILAVEWFKKSALQGHPESQYKLGQIYRLTPPGKGVKRSDEKAVKWYKMAALNPYSYDGGAELEIGRLYERGRYFSKDIYRAIEWYKKSSEKGNSYASGNLGAIYFRGLSPTIGPNINKAIMYTTKGAEAGHAGSQMNLALVYKNGTIKDTRNHDNHLMWLKKAEKSGHPDAARFIAQFYQYGLPPDYKKDVDQAFKWYKEAALTKSYYAQHEFAKMYENGEGTNINYIQAYIYYHLSHVSYREKMSRKNFLAYGSYVETNDMYYSPSKLALKRLERKMTLKDIKRAELYLKELKK